MVTAATYYFCWANFFFKTISRPTSSTSLNICCCSLSLTNIPYAWWYSATNALFFYVWSVWERKLLVARYFLISTFPFRSFRVYSIAMVLIANGSLIPTNDVLSWKSLVMIDFTPWPLISVPRASFITPVKFDLFMFTEFRLLAKLTIRRFSSSWFIVLDTDPIGIRGYYRGLWPPKS